MTVTEPSYPRFLPGQVLTDQDLNDLRTDLVTRVRGVGPLIGFGVGCGLDGSVVNGKLQVTPGYAVDQDGQVLVMRTPVADIEIEPTDPVLVFPFVDPGPGGFSAVLRMVAHEEAAPGDCGDPECEGHSARVREGPEVVLVRGRLKVEDDLTTDPVFALRPVATGDPGAKFKALRDGLVTALRARGVAAAILAELQKIDKTGPVAHDVLRASLLDTVLYATWDLYRCVITMRMDCFRDADPPGVVLGHLREDGASWVWECEWRHHFVLSAAIQRALLGTRCDDPCARLRDRVAQLIEAFRLPDIPKPGDPPRDDTGGLHIDLCALTDDCIFFLPAETDYFFLGDPTPWERWRFQQGGFTDPHPDRDRIDPARVGIVQMADALGWGTEVVLEALSQTLAGTEVANPQIELVDLDDGEQRPEGYVATATAAASDRFVLVVQDGKVVETGAVRTWTVLRDAPGTLPTAERAAAQAVETAGRALTKADANEETSSAIEERLQGLHDHVGQLQTEHDDLATDQGNRWQAIGATTTGLAQNLEMATATTAGLVREALRGEVEGRIQGALSDLRLEIHGTFTQDLEQVRTEVQDVHSQVSDRLDRLLPGRFDRSLVPANAAVVETVRSLRSAVLAASTQRQRPAVERALDAAAEHFDAIDAAAAEDRPLTATQGQALLQLATALAEAVRAAGASGAEIERVDQSLTRLAETLT